ncbi:MAG: hypothetical protein DWH91_17040 [Planctomycetota bacterium]|nr:MAG: hypothetical protein DWH91_17040 [Planctomycetota bacterium]
MVDGGRSAEVDYDLASFRLPKSRAMTEPVAPDLSAFLQLSASRRAWIQEVLIPWCRQANLPSLFKAEMEWGDIAGRIDPQFSLWLWAWSRFPGLYVEGLRGLDETWPVRLTLRDGSEHTGYPDSRRSSRSQLRLTATVNEQAVDRGPFNLDQVVKLERVAD